jgi:hypothetical protein
MMVTIKLFQNFYYYNKYYIIKICYKYKKSMKKFNKGVNILINIQ